MCTARCPLRSTATTPALQLAASRPGQDARPFLAYRRPWSLETRRPTAQCLCVQRACKAVPPSRRHTASDLRGTNKANRLLRISEVCSTRLARRRLCGCLEIVIVYLGSTVPGSPTRLLPFPHVSKHSEILRTSAATMSPPDQITAGRPAMLPSPLSSCRLLFIPCTHNVYLVCVRVNSK